MDFSKFVKILIYLIKITSTPEVSDQINYDYIDAFVALGGETDGSGCIHIEVLERALQEFELNIDVWGILNKLGLSGNDLDYLMFCKLFDTPIFSDNQSLHSFFSGK